MSGETVLKFTKATRRAFSPVRSSSRSAGFDLKSAYNYTISKHGKQIIDTGIKIELPEGSYGRIAARSGLAATKFIDVGGGVVDEDYRGNILVLLFNHSEEAFVVKTGDRIAQLICERIYYPRLEEVHRLSDTVRGGKGFGSTGID